ncbi:hypothetical protein E8F11_27110 [Pseudomonas sp. BN417]|uniref:DUF6933 domain-containing protein n=1 Tax=Pseudomonas sp. BN417 TaxID=2567890 RepID=UPI0024556B5B|nr:hypothetical protein [Pseudomonas sp. BN417]MDH4558796.1 hypothetical protein [Pseudomonas sp. BN417]
MLIFNCTGAVDDFFSVVEKGRKFSRAQRPSPGEEADNVASRDGEPRLPSRWVVHAIRVRRKPVLLAMHVETRYCMVFVGIKRGDLGAFVQLFIERWLNEMQRFGMKLGALTETELPLIVARFMDRHGGFQLIQAGDRSVQAHMNEVLRQFRGFVEDYDSFPEDDLQASAFDEWANDTPRSTGLSKDYFFPDIVMFETWLRQFCGASDERVAEARRRWQAYRRNAPEMHSL